MQNGVSAESQGFEPLICRFCPRRGWGILRLRRHRQRFSEGFGGKLYTKFGAQF